jgi:imidazolonepropionase-like amidohydrolase
VGYALRDATEDHPAYARIVASCPIMAPPGGYAGLLAVESPDDGRRKVDDILDLGADLIKIAFEDSLPPGQHPPLLGLPEAQAIVAEAHRRGVLVSAHVTQRHHLEQAVAAGVDDVAHMIRDDLPDALVAEMVRRGIYWAPTLELWQGVGLKGSTVANLAKFVAAGGQVALGTDYAGYSIPFQLGMPTKEIALMAEAGMSPMQIIVAATRNAAHVSGIADRAGTLEPGKAADILVVNGDPLTDLNALANVRLVLRGGSIIRQ